MSFPDTMSLGSSLLSSSNNSGEDMNCLTTEFTMPPYVGLVLSTIIDDAIDQLYILGAGLVPKTTIRVDDLEKRAKKYVADDPIFDPETGDPFEVSFYKRKIMKLFFDSSKSVELLSDLKNELRYDKDFACLSVFLKEIKKSKIDEMLLFSEEKKNLNEMNNLKQTLLTEQRVSQDNIHSLNEEIAILKDQAQDVLFENLVRTRHVGNWESARIEQNNLICFNYENELAATIENYKNEIEKEIRVNYEIETFILENQREMEEQIEAWMERYDKDSESRTVEIAVLKEKREDLAVEYITLKEAYDLRQKDIDDYLQYKENLRLEEERNVFLTVYAIKIQAWWRGVMVRRGFGRFRPKQEKGKGKGKKKK